MGDNSPDNSSRKDFICGVVEGFYGRPWTTEQRKDLFQKLKKWNMQMYVYAPKDDYKHRAYWRELYTVEEAEHLTSLISAAKAQGITFCYALSPGLDITYSNQKEITTLKRKLEQVSQFGCTCFALLFDDIEPEMCEADKQIFQSFAHAQVSVTNEVHQHLGCPRFIVCPTQYCAARAAPDVSSSEYLHTLGTKLAMDIDIMWTGNKVITKTLTAESVEEITQVLRRPPVIWDNLHANDYDQKRIFLGPYCGRSPELIPLLRGVLTNPNCEYNSNHVAVRTLAHWAGCSLDAPLTMDSVSWDIKLESQGEQGVSDDPPAPLSANVYHHRQALRLAIQEWLPEFSIPKAAQPPIIKPQPIVVAAPPTPIVPILPSVNTCMPLCACTATHSTAHADMTAIPTVSASQLSALAPITPMESVNPISNPVMNSLVSATKVVVNESIPNPITPMVSSNINIPSEMPVSAIPHPVVGLKHMDKGDEAMSDKNDSPLSNNGVNDSLTNDGPFVEDKKDEDGDQIILDEEKDLPANGTMSVEDAAAGSSLSTSVERLDVEALSDVNMSEVCSENGSMQVEPSHSPVGSDMMVEPPDAADAADTADDEALDRLPEAQSLSADDLLLLCEAFYLPFEHGSRALRLLQDYHWLLSRAHATRPAAPKPEMMLSPAGAYPYYEHYAPAPLFPTMSVNVSMNMTMHGCPPDQLCPQVQWNQNSTSPSVNVVYPQSQNVISPSYPSATYSFTADFRPQPDPLITASNFKPQPPKSQGYYQKQNYQKTVPPLKRSPSKTFDQKMDGYGMEAPDDYGYGCVAGGGKVQVGALSGCSEEDELKPNLCRICGKTYARPSTLKTHLRTHSGERPYRCADCHKSFSQAANLTAHVRTHTGQKPFRCPICDRRFSQSSSVTTHMRTHSGERPYQCRSCKKAFSDSSTLTKHLRIHSGEKPYQCKLCLLRFSQSGNLNRHMRVHGSAPGALG